MNELPRTLKLATIWLLIGTAVFLAVQAWQHQQRQSRFSVSSEAGQAVIQLRRGPDGHYHWPGRVNGVAVDFLVDTGATTTALPDALARAAGAQTEGQVRSQTAGGTVIGSTARIDLELAGGVQVQRLRATVLPTLGGAPLLGMDVLGRLSLLQQGDVLTIRPGP
jgi:aspartyl protease family protein